MKEDTGVPAYPTILEMQGNTYGASHPVLTGGYILDVSSGVPNNPWSLTTIPVGQQDSVFNCGALTKGFVRSAADEQNFGWCYIDTTGAFWANSNRNGNSVTTENQY